MNETDLQIALSKDPQHHSYVIMYEPLDGRAWELDIEQDKLSEIDLNLEDVYNFYIWIDEPGELLIRCSANEYYKSGIEAVGIGN